VVPGQITVIIGYNGSGKTTLIKSLVGILDFTRGNFFLDNVEVSQLYDKWYREKIIYSPQEPQFIDGSIRDNIIGENKIDQENLVKILKEVDLINFINSEQNGINKQLDNRGEQLPLGIRKRMSLARALINDGTLAYLDEPTEGLDKEGKKAVLDIIKRLKVQKKTILIASNDQEIINSANILIDLNSKPKPIIVKQKN
jgi:ATP-binding cassette subfamily C protein LapB